MYPQNHHIHIPRHHPLAEGPIMRNFHFCIFCIMIDLPLVLSGWLIFRFWTLIVYVQIVVCYVFAIFGIWLVLLLRISFRLLSAFLLWPGCWASPHWPSHLGSVQTTTSTANMSCYHHCNNYSSEGELQCQLIIIMSLPQWSMLGNPSCLLNFMANCWCCLARAQFYLPHSVVSGTLHSVW